MKQYTYLIMSVLAAGLTALAGCKNNATGTTGNETAATELTPVKFNADSAYANVVAQCDFGARVPNSEAHRRCGDYLVARFKALGLDVEEQKATFTGWDKNELQGRNIIASGGRCAHHTGRPLGQPPMGRRRSRHDEAPPTRNGRQRRRERCGRDA